METIIAPASQYTPDENRMVRDVNVSFDKRETESIVHITQYDEVLPVIAVHLWNNSSPYKIPDGAAVNVRLCKADKTYVYNPSLGVSEDRNTVYIEVTAQMAAADGLAMAIVEVVNSGIAGTGVFVLDVGKNPVPDDVIQSKDEYKALYEYARETEELARAAADSERLAGEHESAAKQHMTDAGESAYSANQSAQKAGEHESAAEGYKDEASTTLEEVTALAEQVSNDAAFVSADATRAEKAAEEAQRVSQGSVGYYATPEALRKAHATAEDGNWAIVGTTDTIWVWDSDTEDWTDSGNKTDLSQYYTRAEVDAKVIRFTVTLPAASWTNGQQTVTDERFLTDDKYVYIVDCAGEAIRADDVTTAGKMTFHADIVPTGAVKVEIIRMEVGT